MKLLLDLLLLVTVAGSVAAFGLEGPAQDPLAAGPQHALLQKTAGTWDAVLVFHDPNGPEQRSRGTLTRTRLAGFHVVDSFEGTLLGAPFVGQSITGYCGARGEFFSYSADSMTPSPMTLRGHYDEAKRELALEGECFGASGGLEKCRTVTRLADEGHMTHSMFATLPDGKEAKLLTIEYTRVQR